MTSKTKEHFVKMAIDMLGDKKVMEIIEYLAINNKVPRNIVRSTFKSLKRCKYIKVNDTDVVNIKEIPYE
jgi:uncharacterized protein (UPF0147 family)